MSDKTTNKPQPSGENINLGRTTPPPSNSLKPTPKPSSDK